MRCKTARYMLALELDASLGLARSVQLHAHLDACPDCRWYRDALQAAHASLQSTLSSAFRNPTPSPGFPPRLHDALQAAAIATANTPMSRVLRAMDALASSMPHPSLRWRTALAIPLAAALAFIMALSQPTPPPDPVECGTIHLASFNVRPSSDGRLLASVAASAGTTTSFEGGRLR